MATRTIRLDDDAQAFEDMKAGDAIRFVILI
jgi:Zn-dependent alcohol dehydrogenase